jgi:hypothetical protein
MPSGILCNAIAMVVVHPRLILYIVETATAKPLQTRLTSRLSLVNV